MKKIISLFQRNYDGDRLVRDEIVPGAEWVVAGEGIATRKFDGTACMIRAGRMFKRYDVKKGRKAPPDFEPTQDPDPVTGHWPGWIPINDGPDDKWFRQGLASYSVEHSPVPDGTYELCGPKINGNPEKFEGHVLVPHGVHSVEPFPRTFDEIKAAFTTMDIEGVVWWNTDGRMVKIKAKDFGIKRGGAKP